jgi:chromosomal replication initiation ATPase DnaA
MRQRKEQTIADERILGGRDFTAALLEDVERQTRETLRLVRHIPDLPALCRIVAARECVAESDLRSGSRTQSVVRARQVFSQLAIGRLRYRGAEVARFLGVTTSTVNRAARREASTNLENYF